MTTTTDWALRAALAIFMAAALISPSCDQQQDPSEYECALKGKPTQRLPGGRQKCHGD